MFLHGTANGYNNRGCRCDECRAAWRDYERERRRKRGQLPRAEWIARQRAKRTHTIGTYNKGCRCDQCREAARVARARHRASPGG
jgi:hypothetical protein